VFASGGNGEQENGFWVKEKEKWKWKRKSKISSTGKSLCGVT
jgi:hypothetical protein